MTRAQQIEKVARELLVLYHWRFLIAEEEGKVPKGQPLPKELKARLREFWNRLRRR